MTQEERSRLIEQYASGADVVAAALEGFPRGQLRAHPLAGKWSACEIVHHLADSESISAQRLRRLIADPHPVIQGYDQAHYARVLRYDERELAPALEAFRAARAVTVPLLRLMSEEEWRRPGYHTEMGPYDAETWLRIYARHAHDHAAQIVALREALSRA